MVAKAKDFLQNLIREKDMPPKPTLDIDMAEFRYMRNLMIKVQDKAREIKTLQDKVLPQLPDGRRARPEPRKPALPPFARPPFCSAFRVDAARQTCYNTKWLVCERANREMYPSG